MDFAAKMQSFILKRHNLAKKFFSKTSASFWEKKGISNALSTFANALNTEAYRDVLKKSEIDPSNVKTIADFVNLPVLDKESYIYKYTTEEMYTLPLNDTKMYYISSGTSGKNTFWPKEIGTYRTLDLLFDFWFCHFYSIEKRHTLLINTYNLGVYASGISMALIGRYLAERHQITITNPGTELENTMIILEKLASHYDQVMIAIYPSFLRTLIDEMEKRKFNMGKTRVILMLAGEPYTQEYRKYIEKKFNIRPDDLGAIFDVYGTSECGTPGLSTPVSNLIFKLAADNKKLAKDLFGEGTHIPQLFQNNPASVFIEELGNELVHTYNNQAPIVRYNIHDRGGKIPYDKLEIILHDHNIDIHKLMPEYGLSSESILQWPIVYVYGRNDAIIIGGGNVYAEDVAPAILNRKNKYIYTFKLEIKELEDMTQKFFVHLCLKHDLKKTDLDEKVIVEYYHDTIVKRLLKINQDYAIAFRTDPKSADPIISMHEYGKGPFAEDHKKTKDKFIITR